MAHEVQFRMGACLKRVDPGFTLIELLVVVTIIAILASFLLPSMNMVRNQALKTKCKGNLRSLSTAEFLYVNDNDGYFSQSACCLQSDWDIAAPYQVPDPRSGAAASSYPPACRNSYYNGSAFPYFYSTLIDYDVIPIDKNSGAVPANLRCPARQEKTKSGGGRPYMVGDNGAWSMSYWYNYPKAAGKPNTPKQASSARLIFDHFWPDWVKYDFMHKDGTTSTVFVDGHAETESYETNRLLNEDLSSPNPKPGVTTNSWFCNGWTK